MNTLTCWMLVLGSVVVALSSNRTTQFLRWAYILGLLDIVTGLAIYSYFNW